MLSFTDASLAWKLSDRLGKENSPYILNNQRRRGVVEKNSQEAV